LKYEKIRWLGYSKKTKEVKVNDFYKAAVKIAQNKLFRDEKPTKLASPRLGTGGSFQDIFLWDTAFSSMWACYHPDIFPVEASLDNFYNCQEPNGFISRQICPDGISKWSSDSPTGFAPPLLAWAELCLEKFIPGRLEKVYEILLKQHKYNRSNFRRKDGLYFSDVWGCGLDNSPRWDEKDEITAVGGIPFKRSFVADPTEIGDRTYNWMVSQNGMPFYWNRQLGWCDTSCQMAFNALNLAKIADKIGKHDDAVVLRQEHTQLAELINDLCFDEKKGFYFDRLGNKTLSRYTISGFWGLISEVATPEIAEKVISVLENPRHFNRPYGIPTLSASDKEYMPENGYAKGPAWAHTNYMVFKGLEKYGRRDLAVQYATKFYNAAKYLWEKTGTIWENYSPEQMKHEPQRSCRDFCGWSALIPITYYHEFINQ